jgi:D-alanyl-D-alanine carboxypeptidase/D-alanyl-D-alanine-endopeptidase (penicillin-binding protein 4)
MTACGATQSFVDKTRENALKAVVRSALQFVVRCALGLFAIAFTPTQAAMQAGNLPPPVMQVMKRYGLPAQGLSVYAQVIGAPRPFLNVAADEPRNPASVLKLVTTLAALEELGPAFQWKTEVYGGVAPRDGHLDGDLYLKGYGDPYLAIEQFWRLVRGLRLSGLEEVSGDLVLDQSYFASEPGDPAEFDGQPLRAYNVLPRALLVNFQAVQIRVVPEAKRVRVIADPPVATDNRLKLVGGPCRGGGHQWSMRVRNGNQTRLVFDGNYRAACGETELYRVLSETGPYVHGVFQALWQEQGGRLRGGWRDGATPPDARLLYTFRSPPLVEVIRLINKFSNNVMARQLLLTLGAERFGPPGTSDSGSRVVHEWLRRRQLDFPELVLDNGAGLSRAARISARSLARLLLAAYQGPYMPEFMSALPLSGQDGTLAHRFGGELAGRLHLKTGSLDGVRSLAGYVLDSAGRWVVVVCVYNDVRANGNSAEAMQQALLEWIYERRPRGEAPEAADDGRSEPDG